MVALGGKAKTASQVKTVLSADKLKDEHLHTGLSELLNEVSSAVKHQHSLTPFKSLKLDPHHLSTSFPAERCWETQHHLEDQQPPVWAELRLLRRRVCEKQQEALQLRPFQD